jgi:FAD/FMN-containing dehydrogenase
MVKGWESGMANDAPTARHAGNNGARTRYAAKKQRLQTAMRDAQGQSLRLGKDISHLFRDRSGRPQVHLDVRDLTEIIEVDPTAGTLDTMAMATYDSLSNACFAQGLVPAVVPQLKSITIGGAISGLGIESSSFKYGLSHETVEEMEVLLPDGDVVLCRADNEHSDLFFGLANSFGTLGYVLRVKAKAVPARRFVKLTHIHHSDPVACLRDLKAQLDAGADFIDGVAFAPGELAITLGHFTDEAPYTSDYTYEKIYYRSIRERQEDTLTTLDYLWRWDTDWFWCSKVFLAQHPVVRRLYGRKRLNSMTYMKLLRINNRFGIWGRLNKLRGVHTEAVIQDVPIPIDRAAEFLEFFQSEIGIQPVWLCPIRAFDRSAHFPLFPLDPNVDYVNFGFWDSRRSKQAHPPGHFNRLIEAKVTELDGLKSLYSDVYLDEEAFWEIYDRPAYERLKNKYDPHGHLKDIYRKCILKE